MKPVVHGGAQDGTGRSGGLRRTVVLAAWALLMGLMSLAAPAAWGRCRLSQIEIPVRIIDQRPIATLMLNGTAVPMLVDSGAFFSSLSASTAAQLKLPLRRLPWDVRIMGYTGDIDAMLTSVARVGLQGHELGSQEFIVGGNELGAGIMGVLGRNILATADAEYDLAQGMVRLMFPRGDCAETNFAYWAGDAPVIMVPLEQGDGRRNMAIQVAFAVNGKRTVALLDTGAPSTALTLAAARRASIEQRDLRPFGRVGGAGAGVARSWAARVALIELAGQKISNVDVRVDDVGDKDWGMLLGLDYFLAHRIYVSRLQGRAYITWNGGPVFALGRNAPVEHDARHAAPPQNVAPDDAGALVRRAAAATAAENYPSALVDLNRACALAPGMADCFLTRALLHLRMRAAGLALADFNEALRLEPAQVDARSRRAWLRASLGDVPGALDDLAQLDAALPPSGPQRADMGELYARMGQVPQALRQFELWVDTHPSDARLARILNSRCWMRARLNVDLAKALQDCRQAVDRDGGAASYRDSLGWTYLRLDDAESAKKAFDAAIKIEPVAYSHLGRALALLRLNDPANAELDRQAARKLKPSIEDDARQEGFDIVDRLARSAGS
ncbi:MAG: retroviral-like aspartic protease family protein [Aquabacterium sp.]